MDTENREYLLERTIDFSFFGSARVLFPQVYRVSWGEMVTVLCDHEVMSNNDGPGYVAAVFREGAKRGPKMVEEVTAVVADFHGITIDKIKENLKRQEIEFVIHSTFNHAKEFPRFRVFIPLERSLPPETFRRCWHHINNDLFENVANQCMHRASHFYWFPACQQRAEKFSFHNAGRFYVPREPRVLKGAKSSKGAKDIEDIETFRSLLRQFNLPEDI